MLLFGMVAEKVKQTSVSGRQVCILNVSIVTEDKTEFTLKEIHLITFLVQI